MKLLLLLCFLLMPILAQAELQVNVVKVVRGPVVDGDSSDRVWQRAKPVLINDQTADETILLSALYTDERIYFLVQYPDKAENPLHEPWTWDADNNRYVEGAHREDTFVFKWNMMAHDVNLSNFSDDDYRADIWYWKANRSNLSGYADDKIQILSSRSAGLKGKTAHESDEGKRLHSFSGRVHWLTRLADKGKAPYRKVPRPAQFSTQVINRFLPAQPTGSRGDVKAMGRWQSGFWFIEFSRKLRTGHKDDIQFSLDKSPLFGVSIFSLYGNNFDVNSPNLYGMGRISEPLRLHFIQPVY
jgi:hypothetical protein